MVAVLPNPPPFRFGAVHHILPASPSSAGKTALARGWDAVVCDPDRVCEERFAVGVETVPGNGRRQADGWIEFASVGGSCGVRVPLVPQVKQAPQVPQVPQFQFQSENVQPTPRGRSTTTAPAPAILAPVTPTSQPSSYAKVTRQKQKLQLSDKGVKACQHVQDYCKQLRIIEQHCKEAQGYCLNYLAQPTARTRRNFVLAGSALYLVIRLHELEAHGMPNVTHEAIGRLAGASKSAVQRCSSHMKNLLNIELPL